MTVTCRSILVFLKYCLHQLLNWFWWEYGKKMLPHSSCEYHFLGSEKRPFWLEGVNDKRDFWEWRVSSLVWRIDHILKVSKIPDCSKMGWPLLQWRHQSRKKKGNICPMWWVQQSIIHHCLHVFKLNTKGGHLNVKISNVTCTSMGSTGSLTVLHIPSD